MAFTALDALRQSGILVASDGAEYLKIGEFDPVDATSNPSLVCLAVSKPEYTHIFDDAVRFAQARKPEASLEERTELAMDRLLVQVGAEILKIVPGRVSVSVDPRLGYDYYAILNKAKSLIHLFESELHIPPNRVLIKIPATYPGILAAHTLESLPSPIHTNLTLVFGLVQAVACAQAGVAVISPFIGRVKDWWDLNDNRTSDPTVEPALRLEDHPGIKLVREIRRAYTVAGAKTQVMAAGFRTVDEIVELGKYGREGGPDLVTLPPDLLDGLRRREGVRTQLRVDPKSTTSDSLPLPRYFDPTDLDAAVFEKAIKDERIALDKVPEGLEKFSKDARVLEARVRAALEVLERDRERKSEFEGLSEQTSELERVLVGKGLEGIEWGLVAEQANLNLCVVDGGMTPVGCQTVKVK